MSQFTDSHYLSSRYRNAVHECASSMSSFSSGYGYMTPPPSATSRRHSAAMSVDSSGQFLSGSLPNTDSSSFAEPPTPTSSTSSSSSRHHSIAYSTFQLYPVSDSSPSHSQQYNEPSTPPDSHQPSNSEVFINDASYFCANSSSPFSTGLKPGVLDEELLMAIPGMSNSLSTNLTSQVIQDGRISAYEQDGSIAAEGISGFDPLTGLDSSFSISEIDYDQNCTGLPILNSASWPTHSASLETVVPSHTFMFSSPPSSPCAHLLGSPIKLEQLPPQRTSFEKLSAHPELSPESSPNITGHNELDMAATPTPRIRAISRFRKGGRMSGWKPGNKTTLQFPMCDIRKIEKIQTNPCLACGVAFKRPEHLKRHLITDQHSKNAMKMGIKCPSPTEKPVYPCLIPNCKKGLHKAPFVGRRDNLTQHYKNTHFNDKHRNGGGKNDWISINRAEELGLGSKDPRNKDKYEG